MATFTVTTLKDENDGPGMGEGLSLREAVQLANESPSPDTIAFDPTLRGAVAVGDEPQTHIGLGVIELPDRTYDNIVRIAPGENFAERMAGQPDGTLYIVGQGLHRGQQVVPNDFDAFVGEPDAVMNGAIELMDFQEYSAPDGKNTWDKDVNLQEFHRNTNPVDYYPDFDKNQIKYNGDCLKSVPPSLCGRPEMLYAGDQQKIIMLERTTDVNTAKFAWSVKYPPEEIDQDPDKDLNTGRITLNFDPKEFSEPLELGIKKFAFGYDAEDFAGLYEPERRPDDALPASADEMKEVYGVDIYSPDDAYAAKPRNVVIQNLTVEKYANPAQTGAIGYFRPGLDWEIGHNKVQWNYGVGIKFKGAAVVRGNEVVDNGQMGLGAGDGCSPRA